jgi:hypothetical protein
MDDNKFVCAGCKKELPRSSFHEFRSEDRKRPVTSRCRDCRRRSYYSSRYETVCACCMENKPIDSNSICRKCNEEAGLRECVQCRKILPLYLKFYGRERRCKECK